MRPKNQDFHEISDSLHENRSVSSSGGPAGGSALERASPPKGIVYMTRRAFLRSKSSNTGAGEI